MCMYDSGFRRRIAPAQVLHDVSTKCSAFSRNNHAAAQVLDVSTKCSAFSRNNHAAAQVLDVSTNYSAFSRRTAVSGVRNFRSTMLLFRSDSFSDKAAVFLATVTW